MRFCDHFSSYLDDEIDLIMKYTFVFVTFFHCVVSNICTYVLSFFVSYCMFLYFHMQCSISRHSEVVIFAVDSFHASGHLSGEDVYPFITCRVACPVLQGSCREPIAATFVSEPLDR